MSALNTETVKQLVLLTRRLPSDSALILACRDYGMLSGGGEIHQAGAEIRHLRVIASHACYSLEGLYEKASVSLDLLDRLADELSAVGYYLLRIALKSAIEVDAETSIEAWKQIEADARCASTALGMEATMPSLYRDMLASTLRNIIMLAREKSGRPGARELQA